jgi:dihydroorotate dehydrogenase
MIKFSNGREIEYFTASGALAFDGRGWPWDRPLIRFGLLKPELFGVVLKSLTLQPRIGNLRWWKPWDCVRILKDGGAVNKVGLTNKGYFWWRHEVAPKLDFKNKHYIVSLAGKPDEIIAMALALNDLELAAIEYNPSCPNDSQGNQSTAAIVNMGKRANEVSRHPGIIKLAANQEYVTITEELLGFMEAVSFNSLAWKILYPYRPSPLNSLERRVGGGGGGVSGKPLQKYNWNAMQDIHNKVPEMPLIASSIMEYDDLEKARNMGASAVSFGTIHLPGSPWRPWELFTNPCKPTRIVIRETQARAQEAFFKSRYEETKR